MGEKGRGFGLKKWKSKNQRKSRFPINKIMSDIYNNDKKHFGKKKWNVLKMHVIDYSALVEGLRSNTMPAIW